MNALFLFTHCVIDLSQVDGHNVKVTLDNGKTVTTVWGLLSRRYRPTIAYPQL